MNANEKFERFAEHFNKKFGYYPLGKDVYYRPDLDRVLMDLAETERALQTLRETYIANQKAAPVHADNTPKAGSPEGSPKPCSLCGCWMCPSCGRPVNGGMGLICECGYTASALG